MDAYFTIRYSQFIIPPVLTPLPECAGGGECEEGQSGEQGEGHVTAVCHSQHHPINMMQRVRQQPNHGTQRSQLFKIWMPPAIFFWNLII